MKTVCYFLLPSSAAFLTQTVCLDDTTVKFEIWDTAGQERYHSLAPMYYRGAQAAIVVYDITSQDTFGRAKNWIKELQRQASPNIVIALAGNKADLSSKRMVEYEVLNKKVLKTQQSQTNVVGTTISDKCSWDNFHIPVAQLVENWVVMREVVSSTPAVPILRVLK